MINILLLHDTQTVAEQIAESLRTYNGVSVDTSHGQVFGIYDILIVVDQYQGLPIETIVTKQQYTIALVESLDRARVLYKAGVTDCVVSFDELPFRVMTAANRLLPDNCMQFMYFATPVPDVSPAVVDTVSREDARLPDVIIRHLDHTGTVIRLEGLIRSTQVIDPDWQQNLSLSMHINALKKRVKSEVSTQLVPLVDLLISRVRLIESPGHDVEPIERLLGYLSTRLNNLSDEML
ncbi:MAG: hypothetical protein ACFB51_10290 [Anaerolineae bacterium]